MTFEEAADAYEMIQSGLSLRKTARVIGISHRHLGRIIASCLEFGKNSPALTHQRGGTPHFPHSVLVSAGRMRLKGLSWKVIGRDLGVDPEKIARAYRHYDRPITRRTPPCT